MTNHDVQNTQTSESEPSTSRNKRRRQAKEDHTQECQQHPDTRAKLENLSLETWHIILQDIWPSQLTQVAQVKPYLYDVVASLPIWKTIAETAHLGVPKSRGKQQTYYTLVLSFSERVCEQCYKGCKKIRVYEMPLPVSLEVGTANLCLQCRKSHFEKHPEPSCPGTTLYERQAYGGLVGVDAYRNRNQNMRQKRDQVHYPERAERRTYISRVFADAGRRLDESIAAVSNFIKSGGEESRWERQVTAIINALEHNERTATRREQIVQKLREHGLSLRSDSRLCDEYIQYGAGDIDDIVVVMREMDWYFRETDYSTLRLVQTHDDWSYRYWDGGWGYDYWRLNYQTPRYRTHVDSEAGKRKALDQYVRRRFTTGKWNDVGSDDNTPARPPPSLWPRIRTLSRPLWQKHADTYISEGIDACQGTLLLCNPDDRHSFDDQMIVRVLNLGATASIREAISASATSFCDGMRIALGGEKFDHYISMTRRTVMRRIQTKYTLMGLDSLPSGVSDFVSRCSIDSPLSDNEYRTMEQSFIDLEMPVIASQENVHPGYLIFLLKQLKECGRIRTKHAKSTT